MIVFGLRQENARTRSLPLLAHAVGEHFGLSFLPEIARTDRGKPYFPSHPHLHFNLSHSGDFLVCALDDAPVGVDIQIPRPSRSSFLDRLCSPTERAWLASRRDAPHTFALFWAMKESRCKWSGLGITRPISNIAIPLPQDNERLLTLDSLTFSLRSGPDWQFCLCSTKEWTGEIQWLTDL